MSTYEQLVLHGIPFLHSNGVLYYYELPSTVAQEPIRVGTLVGVGATNTVNLDADWLERVQPRVDAWRTDLNPSERGKASRAPKQSKPKRSPKSAAPNPDKAGTAAGATNVVIIPTTTASEAAPVKAAKRVLRRRAPVRPSA